MTHSRFLHRLIVAGFILAAAGCQSDDAGGALGPDKARDQLKPPAEKVKEIDLVGFCPRVSLREGTAFYNSYAKGGQDDPAKLLYQASITDVTRSCKRDNGTLSITVAVAGKVVPGPAGAPGNITMPIRIVMIQGSTVLYSELHKYQLAVGDAAQATQFAFNDPNISIPDPTQRGIQIFAGYDDAPGGKDRKTAAAE